MKILLGGVPFGCDNVGDEAILECAIALIRRIRPNAQITVSTHDEAATAKKLGVTACELMGFDFPYDRAAMARRLEEHDVFIWCGATGLSDYPEIPLELVRIAKAAGRRVILWGVGMNTVLNPAKYSVLPGRRRKLLLGIQMLTLGLYDAVAFEEMRRVRRVKGRIAAGLAGVDLIVTRDPESRVELLNCGLDHEVLVGADSALVLEPSPWERIPMPAEARSFLESPGRKVGICISTAAPRFKDLPGLIRWLDQLSCEEKLKILFLPMDPVTDLALMKDVRSRMSHPENSLVLEGRYEPAEVLGILPRLDVVVTSRLHLIILSSIVATPFVGISCGSKVDNFLHQHGLHAPATVTDCDFARLHRETRRMLAEKQAVVSRIQATRALLLERLESTLKRLDEALGGATKSP